MVIYMYPGKPWWVAKKFAIFLAMQIQGVLLQSTVNMQQKKMTAVITDFQTSGRGGDTGRRILVNEPGLYTP